MASRSFGDEVAQSGGVPAEASPVAADEAGPQPSGARVPGGETTEEPRLALLIGNERYAHNRLATPVADIRMLADLLASLGFRVTRVENGDRQAMHDALAEFAGRIDHAGADAVAFVYFAGHGFQDEGINYLVPVDAELPSRAYLKARTLAVDDIIEALARTARKANVVVLDACRKAPFLLQARSRDVTEGLADLKLPPEVTMLVAYSTSAGAIAADDMTALGADNVPHSPYAAALQQALPGLLEPNRRIHDVFVEAAERVRTTSNGAQSPALYLQGVAPPLNATDADRERFKTWVFYQAFWTWRRIAKYASVAALTIILGASVLWWQTRYPETRAQWLHAAGVSRMPALELDCLHPSDETDRYGMSARAWCASAPDRWPRLAHRGTSARAALATGIAQGDPRALALAAASLFAGDISDAEQQFGSAGLLAARAARVGFMPAWPLVADHLSAIQSALPALGEAEVTSGIARAHAMGVLAATWRLAGSRWKSGRFEDAIGLLQAAEGRDAAGGSALQLGRHLLAGSASAGRASDLAGAVRWLLASAGKGNDEAILQLIVLQQKGAVELSDRDMEAAFARLASLKPTRGLLLRSVYRMRLDDPKSVQSILSDLERAAEGGEVGAMSLLATIYSKGIGDTTFPDKALHWLQMAAAQGEESDRLNYATELANGVPDPSGRPQLAPDPDTARSILEPLAAAGSIPAKIALADLFAVGAFGARDPDKAQAILADASIAKTINPALFKRATDPLNRIALARRVAAAGDVEGLTEGAAEAPVHVVVYMPFGCGDCAQFLAATIEPIRERFVASGLVRMAMRQRYVKAELDIGVDAAMALQCLPAWARPPFPASLIRSFKTWSQLSSREERLSFFRLRARLSNPGKISPEIADACFYDSKDAKDALRSQFSATASILGETDTQPIVVLVDGERLDAPDLALLDRTIVKAMRPQDRPRGRP